MRSLVENAVVLDLAEPMKMEDFFELAAKDLASRLDMTAEQVAEVLRRREEETSTVLSPRLAVPHVVVAVPDPEQPDVTALGREIRFHPKFSPAGTNVNFVSLNKDSLSVRTYERGVEDETLACGTGCVASALVTAACRDWPSPIPVTTRSGGVLTIHFEREGDRFREVYMEGDARIVYTGELHPDALLA